MGLNRVAAGTQLLLNAPRFQALAVGGFTSGEMRALATGTPLERLPPGVLLAALAVALLHAWLRRVRPLARVATSTSGRVWILRQRHDVHTGTGVPLRLAGA